MRLLCDTNVLAELARPAPNPGVLAWSAQVTRVGLSVVTLEEIEFGLAWHPKPGVRAWLEAFVTRHCEVVPIDAAVSRHAGLLRGQLRGQGQVRTQADMLIAATAAVHGLVLVTRNEKDFAGCGVAVLNPFR